MRKLLLLICALLTGVSGAWASTTPATGAFPVEGKTYYLFAQQTKSGTPRSYIYNNNGTLSINQGAKETTDAYKWTVTISNGTYTIKNVADNTKYLNVDTDHLILSTSSCSFTLNKDVQYSACVALYTNSKWWVTSSSTLTYSNTGYYLSSFTTNDNWTANYVFEEVLPAHSLADGKYYTIYCDNDNKQYLYDNAGTLAQTSSANKELKYVWKCIVNGDNYNFQNVGTSKYLKHKGVQASAYNFTISTDGVYHDGCATIYSPSSYMGMTAAGLLDQASGHGYDKVTTDFSYDWRFVQLKVVTFSQPIAVNGGSAVSTIYVTTDGSDSFTLPSNHKYSINGTSYNNSDAVSQIVAAGTSDIFVLVDVENNKLYRLQQQWTSGSTFYLYANKDDTTYPNRLWESTANSETLTTNSKYIWQAKSSGSYWKLYNPTADRYIKLAESSSKQGNGGVNGINALTTSNDASGAEPFLITKSNRDGYVNLKSTTQTNIYLDSWSSTDNAVGWHTSATHAGSYFKLIPVKKVTFVDAEEAAVNISVNGWSAVSEIYIATDGSETIELPTDNVYSINGGSNQYAAAAATAISTAGTSDITVTVSDNPEVYVTYKLNFGGNTIATKALYDTPANAPTSATTAFGSAPAYCSYGESDVATITNETTEVNYELVWDGPFDFSTDYANANWCYLKMHGQYLIYSGSSATPNSLGDLASAESAASKAFWAFVGDPFNGFQLINKAAGSDKNLAVKWWNPNMDTQETKWLLQSWNSDFALHTSSYFYLNNAGGQLKLWVSGTSDEAMNFDCAIESVSYKGLALAFIDDYADSHAVGHYFGVATSTYNSVRAGYADAASVSASDYTQLVSFIGGRLPASYPKTGYYRIKSNSGRYIGYGQPEADPMPSVGLRTVSAEDAAKDASTIIHLVKGVGSHQYTMSTQGKNVQSMVNGNTPFPATSDAGVTFVLEALTTTPGKGTIRNTASNNEDNGYINGYLHEANWTVPGVINWEAGSESSQWSIEDVTSIDVTLRDGGDGFYYATCFTDFPVSYTDASNGEGLFVLTGESNGKATAQKVTSVPAKQGFLIRIAEKNVTDSKVTLTIPASVDALAGENILTGTCLATTKPDGNVYVFSKVGDDLGFFLYTGTEIPANRAYILELAGSGTRSFILSFDDTTGINGVSTSMPAGTIFDMQGRRVQTPARGLYIVNGKKVLF